MREEILLYIFDAEDYFNKFHSNSGEFLFDA